MAAGSRKGIFCSLAWHCLTEEDFKNCLRGRGMETLNDLSGSHGKAVSLATYFFHCPAQKIISSFSGALSQKTSISLSFSWDNFVLSS